jgi:hypothetical protein
MAVARAKATGLDLVVARRDEAKLANFASEWGVAHRVFALDFGDGPVSYVPLSFGDLITAWRSTAIPNIAIFVHVNGDAFPQGDLSQLPDGPSREEREAHRARAVAEVVGADGMIAQAVIDTEQETEIPKIQFS